ncbi:MAG TPA: hypothetical protein VGO80_01550 [Solirubrobacteraceae bacterium]|nr:hypothetical protein [Solirubrobacteraceae bacterium]
MPADAGAFFGSSTAKARFAGRAFGFATTLADPLAAGAFASSTTAARFAGRAFGFATTLADPLAGGAFASSTTAARLAGRAFGSPTAVTGRFTGRGFDPSTAFFADPSARPLGFLAAVAVRLDGCATGSVAGPWATRAFVAPSAGGGRLAALALGVGLSVIGGSPPASVDMSRAPIEPSLVALEATLCAS